MRKSTLYLLGMALLIILGCILQWFLCCNCGAGTVVESKPEEVVATPTKPETTKLPFTVKDHDGSLSLQNNDNYNFKTSNYNFETPLSENLNTEIGKLKEYITANPNKSLAVVGLFKKDEKNTSMYPNIGIARANAVKNDLVSKGIPAKIINTYGELKNDMVADENTILYGPVLFRLADGKDNSDQLATLLAEIKANPLILNFQTGEANISLTPEQRTMFAKISTYLDKVDDAKCLIVGHTDSKGLASKNKILGQERANFAKGYLVKNGISADKIEATSKGQTVPIATNDTEEGRAKNRRTEITIK